jgi:hypothetical protein
MAEWVVEPPTQADFDLWRQLYRGYAEFYKFDQSDEQAARVWSWIHDPKHEVRALVARDADGTPVGLAHFRPFARPLRASVGCFLDDLEGWDTVRWITADDNYRARSKYDQVATRTMWITYDMAPGAM